LAGLEVVLQAHAGAKRKATRDRRGSRRAVEDVHTPDLTVGGREWVWLGRRGAV
jgi:hypothetical protein